MSTVTSPSGAGIDDAGAIPTDGPTGGQIISDPGPLTATDGQRLRNSRFRLPRWLGLAIATLFLLLLVVATIAPQLFSPIDPTAADALQALQPPGAEHLLGTDQNGRDVFARVIAGARSSVLIGVLSSALALVAGTLLGVAAASRSRWLSSVVSTLLQVVLSVPGLLFVLLIVAVLGPGTKNAVLGIAVITTPGYARLVRSEVIRLRGAGFVVAATALGWRPRQVVLRHVVPNALGPILVLVTIGIGAAIGAGASLSYLGLGAQEPTAEWGLMLSESTSYFSVAWWVAVFPGLAITATVLSVTVVGQHLQRRFEGRHP